MNKTISNIVGISKDGQITIPQEMQRMLEIKNGDKLVIVIKNKIILIQKAANLEKPTEDDFKDLLKLSEDTARDLWDNKHDEVWNRV